MTDSQHAAYVESLETCECGVSKVMGPATNKCPDCWMQYINKLYADDAGEWPDDEKFNINGEV